MRASLKFLAGLTVLVVLIYALREPLTKGIVKLYAELMPCSKPLTYHIGPVDERFGLTAGEFLTSVKEAAALWEGRSGRHLFEYDPRGAVEVSLIYDYRQQSVDKLRSLGVVIDKSRGSYDAMKKQYDGLQVELEQKKSGLARAVAEFERQQSSYNLQVQIWNDRGGAPEPTYSELRAQKQRFLAEAQRMELQQRGINDTIDTLNAFARNLNKLAEGLNLQVVEYNTHSIESSGEFEEGLYEESLGSKRISIYEFENTTELVRVLAHELGHALGLGHVNDPNSIMFMKNESESMKVGDEDLAELKKVCGMK